MVLYVDVSEVKQGASHIGRLCNLLPSNDYSRVNRMDAYGRTWNRPKVAQFPHRTVAHRPERGAAVGIIKDRLASTGRLKARTSRRGPRVNCRANLPVVVRRTQSARIASRYSSPFSGLRLNGVWTKGPYRRLLKSMRIRLHMAAMPNDHA